MHLEKLAHKKDKVKLKLMLILSTLAAFFWIGGNLFNVYKFAVVGALFEILWLPMLLLLFALPLSLFIFWGKEKFKLRSVYLLLFVSMLSLIIVLNLIK